MKKILFALLALMIQVASPQIAPDQPESLGLYKIGISNDYKYGTLIKEGGNQWAVSCTHYYPMIGRTLTFGNGATAKVQDIVFVRGGYYAEPKEWELSLCKLDREVAAKASEVWWTKPPNFDEMSGNIEITGFGLDGMFRGTNGIMYYADWSEIDTGLHYRAVEPAVVRPGYSGSPIWYQGKLIGSNWGGWWTRDENNNPIAPSSGVSSPIFLILEKFSQNFPEFAHAPQTPSMTLHRLSDGKIRVVLKSPVNAILEMLESKDLNEWSPAQDAPNFLGFDENPGPWETIADFSTDGFPKGFFWFREKHPSPLAMPLIQPAGEKNKTPSPPLFVPTIEESWLKRDQ
jgi:hypothetical protein